MPYKHGVITKIISAIKTGNVCRSTSGNKNHHSTVVAYKLQICRELSENRELNLTLVIILILPVVPNGLHIVVILEVVEQLTHLRHENLSIIKVINNME